MIRVSVENALIVNGILSVACKKIGDGEISVGTQLSDGIRQYSVVGLPFVRYNTVEAMTENICLELKQDGFNEKELAGKTLYVI
jgi:hypothetical protein